MKKRIFAVLLLAISLTCLGCSASGARNVDTMSSWMFQYNGGTDDYSLFFALHNKKGDAIAADVDVDVRIVNEYNEEVYTGTHTLTEDDFGHYTSNAAGQQFLANVRIPTEKIAEGRSVSGKVYFTVYKENELQFEEASCDALYCLPVLDVTVEAESLPVEIKVKDYFGGTTSKIRIDEISYVFEKNYMPQLKITLIGTKTYGKNQDYAYDMISYKLYDSQGFMVDSGTVYFQSLAEGDKVRDDSIIFYDVIPGESYTLKLMEYKL